jgi:hypothetical protein
MRLSEAKRTQLIRYASPVLVEDEHVLDVTIGSAVVRRNGRTTRRKATVLVTDRRVIVYSRMLGGYDVQEYAFGRISGVDHNRGFTTGQLTIRASGGGAEISMVDRRDVARIAQAIRDGMSGANRPSGQADEAVAEPPDGEPQDAPRDGDGGSVTEELEKLARLRNENVITDEEFATQRAKLLS